MWQGLGEKGLRLRPWWHLREEVGAFDQRSGWPFPVRECPGLEGTCSKFSSWRLCPRGPMPGNKKVQEGPFNQDNSRGMTVEWRQNSAPGQGLGGVSRVSKEEYRTVQSEFHINECLCARMHMCMHMCVKICARCLMYK